LKNAYIVWPLWGERIFVKSSFSTASPSAFLNALTSSSMLGAEMEKRGGLSMPFVALSNTTSATSSKSVISSEVDVGGGVHAGNPHISVGKRARESVRTSGVELRIVEAEVAVEDEDVVDEAETDRDVVGPDWTGFCGEL
jgi:hypothetical protein